ncbi:hypothetical protein HFN46_33240 [Rhizobium leguminosarum]|nr:hypothetical protein [Rhizobium leguminosarum]
MDEVSRFLAFLLWTLLWYQAWLAAAGPKLTILYLRRFRLSSAQVVVTAALEQGLSKRYRVVTLDDANFPPMEVPLIYQRLSRYGGPLVWVVGMTVSVSLLTEIFDRAAPSNTGIVFGAILAGVRLFIPELVIGFSAMIIVVVAALLLQRWLVRRRARLSVRKVGDLDRAGRSIDELSRWGKRSALLGPRATIIRVTDDLWRQAVARLAECSNVVLVDLSSSTVNLQWELALLAERSYQHTVFIANRAAEAPVAPPSGRSTLLYDDLSGRSHRKAFLSALTAELNEHVAGPPRPNYRDWIVRPAVACLRALVLFVLAMLGVSYVMLALLRYLV